MTLNHKQLTFWPEDPLIRQEREIAKIRNHCDKLRKSLYARNNELGKQVEALKSDMEILIAAICKGKI